MGGWGVRCGDGSHELIYSDALSITSQLPMNSKSATYTRLAPHYLGSAHTGPEELHSHHPEKFSDSLCFLPFY